MKFSLDSDSFVCGVLFSISSFASCTGQTMKALLTLTVLLTLTGLMGFAKDDPVFSGPQMGEKLPSFKIRGVLDPHEGKEIDPIAQAAGKPLFLLFVHDTNRQSVAMTRMLTTYAKSRTKDGLTTAVVWLGEDATDATNTIKKIQHALTPGVFTGVSPDGREGPGSYGLNRKVMLTILVGNQGKVTANFPLIQPSLQADLPKILEALVKEIGGKAPTLEEIAGAGPNRPVPNGPDETLRGLLRPVIQLTAKPAEVEAAAAKVEEHCSKNPAAKKEVGRIANTIIDAGKLTDYGTPKAQEYLKKWAKEYGAPKKAAPPEAKSR
jgi:hypothetical protein